MSKEVYSYKRSLRPEEEVKTATNAGLSLASGVAIGGYQEVFIPSGQYPAVTASGIIDKLSTSVSPSFTPPEINIVGLFTKIGDIFMDGNYFETTSYKVIQLDRISAEIKAGVLLSPSSRYLTNIGIGAIGSQVTVINGSVDYGILNPIAVQQLGLDFLTNKFITNQATSADVFAANTFQLDSNVFKISSNTNTGDIVNFRVPKIVGPIKAGVPVFIWVVGKGVVCGNSDSLTYGNTADVLQTATSFRLGRPDGDMSFTTSNNKYLNFNPDSVASDTEVKFSLVPDKNVGTSIVYIGVRYNINIFTDIYLIPNTEALYTIVNAGDPSSITLGTTIDTLALWSDIESTSQLQNIVANPTGVCLSNGWLDSDSTGCIFTDIDEARFGYFYDYAMGSNGCDSGSFGVCEPESKLCRPDYTPSLEEEKKYPYSCDPKATEPPSFVERNSQYIIYVIIAIVLIIIVIGVIVYFIYKSKKNKKAAMSYGLPPMNDGR